MEHILSHTCHWGTGGRPRTSTSCLPRLLSSSWWSPRAAPRTCPSPTAGCGSGWQTWPPARWTGLARLPQTENSTQFWTDATRSDLSIQIPPSLHYLSKEIHSELKYAAMAHLQSESVFRDQLLLLWRPKNPGLIWLTRSYSIMFYSFLIRHGLWICLMQSIKSCTEHVSLILP